MKNRILTWIYENPIMSLAIGVAWLFLCCFLFTRPVFFEFFGFDETTGVIGDTIGGITAPVIGLIGIVLVWLTFEAQRKGNEHLRAELDLQFIQALYAEWKKEMSEVQKAVPQAIDSAFSEWVNTNKDSLDNLPRVFLEQLYVFLLSQRILLRRIRESQLSDDIKTAYLSKITYYYRSHLRPTVVAVIREFNNLLPAFQEDPMSLQLLNIDKVIREIDAETSPHLKIN